MTGTLELRRAVGWAGTPDQIEYWEATYTGRTPGAAFDDRVWSTSEDDCPIGACLEAIRTAIGLREIREGAKAARQARAGAQRKAKA